MGQGSEDIFPSQPLSERENSRKLTYFLFMAISRDVSSHVVKHFHFFALYKSMAQDAIAC